MVSQGCRPFGQPWTITRCERNAIFELAGQTGARTADGRVGEALDPDERASAARGCTSASSSTSTAATFGSGDFLVRGVRRRRPGRRGGGDRRRRSRSARRSSSSSATRRRGRGPPRPDAGTARRRRAGVHLQRPGQPTVRLRPITTPQVVAESIGGARGRRDVLCRRARARRRQEHLHGFTASIALFGGYRSDLKGPYGRQVVWACCSGRSSAIRTVDDLTPRDRSDDEPGGRSSGRERPWTVSSSRVRST